MKENIIITALLVFALAGLWLLEFMEDRDTARHIAEMGMELNEYRVMAEWSAFEEGRAE